MPPARYLLPCLSLLASLAAGAAEPDAPPTPPEPTVGAASTEGAVTLETVTVTGEKLRRSESDTTTSVGLRNGRQIDESPVQTLDELVSRMANVGTAQGLSIRGIPLYGPTGGDGKTAVITVDGVPQEGWGQSIASLSVWDADQAEVLRGPQSTNQGRNSLAGAVVLKTRDPTEAWDLRTRMSSGNQNQSRAAIAGGGALLPGVAAFRLSLERNRDDGPNFNETRDDPRWNHFDNQTLRGKLRLTPFGETYRALLTLSEAREGYGDGYVEASSRDEKDRISLANAPSWSNNRTRSTALEQTLRAGGIDFTLLSTYLDAGYDRVGDYDETELPLGDYQSNSKDYLFSQEVRAAFQWPLAGRDLAGVVGAYYSRQNSQIHNAYALPLYYGLYSTGLCASTLGDPEVSLEQCAAVFSATPEHLVLRSDDNDTTVKNRALFLELDYPIGALTLTAGGRYDSEQQQRQLANDTQGNDAYTQGLLSSVGFGPEASPPVRTDYTAWLPKLAARYRYSENWMAGLSWQRGYRAGGISYSYLPISLGGGQHDFGPEFTSNYEFSLKGRPLPRLALGFNAYRIDWRDQQVNIGTSSFDTRIVNAGASRLHGLELEARGPLRPRLELFAALGLSRSEYREFQTASDDYAGHQFPRSPRLTASTGFTWKPGAWNLNADVVHEGGTYSSADNAADQRNPAHTLLNAKLGYRFANGLRLFAYGLNLFDATYSTYRLDTVVGRQAAYLGDARRYGAGLEWRFEPKATAGGV